jgi:hypothetical protein
MARAANLGGIDRRGLLERIEAEIGAGKAARDAMTDVPTEVLVAADPKVAMKAVMRAGPAVAAVAVPSTISPKSSSRS